MTKPILTYFDFSSSRGEECRLALAAAGVDFTDNRITRDQWGAMKATSPFGSLPTLQIEGKPPLAQSNAILAYIGRTYGLLPTDSFEAARHEAILASVEDLRGHTNPITRISEPEKKVAARQELATKYLPTWAGFIEKQIGDGPVLRRRQDQRRRHQALHDRALDRVRQPRPRSRRDVPPVHEADAALSRRRRPPRRQELGREPQVVNGPAGGGPPP
jgi:glutathione S-transferase